MFRRRFVATRQISSPARSTVIESWTRGREVRARGGEGLALTGLRKQREQLALYSYYCFIL